jgi:hypothetical protein
VNKRISVISLMLLLCMNVLGSVQPVFAQNELALGEMRIYGNVFIRSSTGNWIPAPGSYPILPDTEIYTEKGSVSLYYKDGSRVDFSESTTAIISSTNASNTVHLAKGKLALNASPTSSFVITNNTSDIVIKSSFDNGDSDLSERFLGTVSSRDKGIEVQDISGTALLKGHASETKVVTSGEGIFVGSDNEFRTYSTAKTTVKKSDKCYKPKKHASPYKFSDGDDYCYDD